MIIEKKIEGEKAVITPDGKLDTLTAPEFDRVIRNIIPGVTELTFDFEKLEYISSAGLRVLLSAQKAMSGKGKMKLCNLNETVSEIFEVTGFSEILTIER